MCVEVNPLPGMCRDVIAVMLLCRHGASVHCPAYTESGHVSALQAAMMAGSKLARRNMMNILLQVGLGVCVR